MKLHKLAFLFFFSAVLLTSTLSATVQVTAPGNGATVGTPVQYTAGATTNCAEGVSTMGIYVNGQLAYLTNGASVNTTLTLSPGTYQTVVQEWDHCGGSTYTPVAVKVAQAAGVWVNTPANNANVGGSVAYNASATTGCAQGVSTMGIYVNGQLNYLTNGASINTTLTLSPGSYQTVVQEWDHCGGSTYTHVNINVSGNAFYNTQSLNGWRGYGEYYPTYEPCTNCGSGVTWSMVPWIKSPSLDDKATEFSMGGTVPYSDVLFTIPLIGVNSTQGLPDTNHKIVPSIHNFTYDVYFWGSNLAPSQALEFDINQFFNGMGFLFGHECRIEGGNEFDVWDNVNNKWVPTGIACNPVNNAWNHLTLQVARTSNNWLQYHSITLNGVTTVLDWYYPPFNVGNWYGISINYQEDGNYAQTPYSVYVDALTLTYW